MYLEVDGKRIGNKDAGNMKQELDMQKSRLYYII